MCKHRPALVTRKEDLFPLAKKVVKQACKVTDTCIPMSSSESNSSSDDDGATFPKKIKTEENQSQQVSIFI